MKVETNDLRSGTYSAKMKYTSTASSRYPQLMSSSLVAVWAIAQSIIVQMSGNTNNCDAIDFTQRTTIECERRLKLSRAAVSDFQIGLPLSSVTSFNVASDSDSFKILKDRPV